MIRIRAEQREDGLEISAVGHAGYDARGRDIVCAGVSALIFAYLDYVKTHPLTAEAEYARPRAAHGAEDNHLDTDGSGGRCVPEGRDALPRVESRVEDGYVWVRTHGMNGVDQTAWAVTQVGLKILENRYPDHVRLAGAP